MHVSVTATATIVALNSVVFAEVCWPFAAVKLEIHCAEIWEVFPGLIAYTESHTHQRLILIQ